MARSDSASRWDKQGVFSESAVNQEMALAEMRPAWILSLRSVAKVEAMKIKILEKILTVKPLWLN